MKCLTTGYKILLLLLLVSDGLYAQETIKIRVPNHGYPKLTTYTDAQINQLGVNTQFPSISSFGNLPAGISPAPSPESADINRFKDIAVNSFTGTALVPLPLYTLQEGSLSVPISLSYNASGMKTHEVASWSGINMSLVAGGMISRQVRGLPDEGKFDINTWSSSYERKGYYFYGYSSLSTVDDDTEPDVFYLNLHGQTYKFMYKRSGEPKFMFFPDADIEVTPTFEFIDGSAVGRFTKFEVLMPDGTKYVFGDGFYEKSAEVDVKEAQSLGIYPNSSKWSHYWKNEGITSAWYLRKIISPYGQEISFNYTGSEYSFFKVAESQSSVLCPSPNDVEKKINKVYVQGAVLSNIQGIHQKIEFNNRYKVCYETRAGIDYCTFSGPPRLDIDSWNQHPTNQSSAKKLVEMEVMDKVNPVDTLRYTFDYGHFTAVEPDLPTGYTTTDVGYTHTKRLRLEKVTLPDKSTVRFRYNGDDPVYNGKSRLNFGIDHWGYANGATGNRFLTGLLSKDSFFSTCTPSTSDRESDPNFAFEGSLDSIIVSTGSQTKFVYELHQARNYTNGSTYKPIGGARIKEIRNKDLISGIETVKQYSYVMGDGIRPSGFLCMKPIYRFSDNFNRYGANSGIYDRLLAEIGRPVVGYTRVIEQLKDGLGTPLGKTIYTFDQDTTEISTERLQFSNCTTGEVITCDTTRYYQPERIREGLITYHDFKSGNLLKTEVFNQSGDTLSVQTYDYTPLTGAFIDNTFSAKVFKVNGYNLGHFSFTNAYLQEYYLLFKKYRLESQTSKTYSQTGINPIITTQNFTYKDETSTSYQSNYGGKHNFLVKTTTVDGQGHTIESWNKYVSDFSFGVDTVQVPRTCYDPETQTYYPCDTTEYTIHVPKIGSQARGIYEMYYKHIPMALVESITTNQGKIVGATYQNYDYFNTTGNGFKYFAKENYLTNRIGSDTFLETYYSRVANDTLYRDSEYYLNSTIQNYNRFGFATQVKPYGGAVSAVDYDAFNLLPIRGISNVGGIVIDTTQYEYGTKIFGLSKQISPNKLSINYSYYRATEQNKIGQLKQTTDKDGKILSHYEYPYLNQPLINTAGAFTTDLSKNRIVVRQPRIATTNPYQDYDKVSTSVSYRDGSGRALQSVGYKLSPLGKDILSSTPEYDNFGRPKKGILPVVSSVSTGQYRSNSQTLAQSFYNDTAPYSEVTQYESSPFSRAFKSVGAGASFRPNKESEQKYETGNYGLNKYEIDVNGILQISSYVGNQVFKSTGIDEQGNQTIQYSNQSGQVLESHVQFTGDGTQTSHYLKTCYVYDELGRLGAIIPPKLYGQLPNNINLLSSSFLSGLYVFRYDSRNRLVEKHTPDGGWSYMVYNRLGQLVLSQDSRHRLTNQWLFTQYDAFGRVATTGYLVNSYPRASLQTAFDELTATQQYEERTGSTYTNRSFPSAVSVGSTDIYTINYYDDYSWKENSTLPFIAYKNALYDNVKGLPTGNSVRVINTLKWLKTALYYDDKNRLIQSQAENRYGTVNQSDFVFDFIGQLLEERTIYRKPTQADIESKTAYTYDHAGRKTTAVHFLTGHAPEVLASYVYDEIGRMVQKNLNEAQKDSIIRANESLNNGVVDVAKKYILLKPGTTIKPDSVYCAFIGSGLQRVSYAYNIRGALRGINLTSTGALDNSKVFSLKLDYFEDSRFYNGLLSKQSWKTHTDTTTRIYQYGYDKANRYTTAQFKGKTNEQYNENVSYDSNGNIGTLNRFGLESTNNWQRIDSLIYFYPTYSNQLNGITDLATLKGHQDNGTATDYTYYPDGSQKTDANKGITDIIYNFLGLQDEIQFGSTQKIKNIYTADGVKLSQYLINGTDTTKIDYVGELIYINNQLKSVATDEGRIRFDETGKAHYQYFITDHLGSTRVIFEKLNDSVYVAQRADYYPFGGLMEGLSTALTQDSWRFLYQGQEYIDAFGYNMSDFGARGFDSNNGRFTGIDPIDNYALSGYAGMMNNPMSYIDPDGRNPIAIGFMIGIFASSINHMIKGTMPHSMWGFLKPGVIGGIGGAFGAFAPNAAVSGLGKSIAYGAFSGAATGGISDILNGGNGSGALWGAVSGGAMAGIGWGLQREALDQQLHNVETAMAQGDPIPKYVPNSRPMPYQSGAGVIAPRLPAPPSSINWGALLGQAGRLVSRSVGWVLSLATLVEGDVTRRNRQDYYYHYTDEKGFKGIASTSRILPNSKGKVYIARDEFSPEAAFRDLFLSQKTHIGRGDYVIIFQLTPDQVAQLSLDPSQPFELIHQGTLKLRKGYIYAGKNYFKR